MIRIERNGLVVYQFEHSGFSEFEHGIFSRRGGTSSGIYSSLNLGSTVGDNLDRVNENKKRVLGFFEKQTDSIYDVWQVHGNDVVCTDKPRATNEAHIKADAIFSNNPQITVLMRFADCVPILLCDPVKKVAGIIHAGWKGTINNIVKSSIKKIHEQYDCNVHDLVAGIGPSIGPDHYIVGIDVVNEAKKKFGEKFQDFFRVENGKYFFDLWKTNEFLLREQGIREIETSRICTACNLTDWYSHRLENGQTGRFGAVICVRKE